MLLGQGRGVGMAVGALQARVLRSRARGILPRGRFVGVAGAAIGFGRPLGQRDGPVCGLRLRRRSLRGRFLR